MLFLTLLLPEVIIISTDFPYKELPFFDYKSIEINADPRINEQKSAI